MLCNIIDGRERRYRWQKVKAIIEPTCHDNGIKDSDQAPPHRKTDIVCEDKNGISLNEAISWAEEQTLPVTLFLYDYTGEEEE